MINHYLAVLKKYAQFTGRSSRAEFWSFLLVHIGVNLTIMFLFVIFGKVAFLSITFTILFIVYYIAVIVPSLALIIRRLHDVGKSGWWFFVQLIPFFGPIYLVVLYATPGETQKNIFGEALVDTSKK